MEKLVLTDNTELEIMDGASLDYIRIQTDNFAALDQITGALKKEGNLAKVQFKTDDEVTGEYDAGWKCGFRYCFSRENGVGKESGCD